MENTQEQSLDNQDIIDVRELVKALLKHWLFVLLATFFAFIIALYYASTVPDLYESRIVLTSSQEDSKGGIGGVASAYGNLAALAGINLPGGDRKKVDHAITLSMSWPFIEKFINKYDLKPELMAVTNWDKPTNTIEYDSSLYNETTKQWKKSGEGNETLEPNSWQAYQAFISLLNITRDSSSDLVTISFKHQSPYFSEYIVTALKDEINLTFQAQDMEDAQKNITYLEEKIKGTSISEMQSVFYKMIESQTRTLMLAEVSDQYLLKTVVPSKVPEATVGPKRSLIIMIGIILGLISSITLVILRSLLATSKHYTPTIV